MHVRATMLNGLLEVGSDGRVWYRQRGALHEARPRASDDNERVDEAAAENRLHAERAPTRHRWRWVRSFVVHFFDFGRCTCTHGENSAVVHQK